VLPSERDDKILWGGKKKPKQEKGTRGKVLLKSLRNIRRRGHRVERKMAGKRELGSQPHTNGKCQWAYLGRGFLRIGDL